MSDHTEIAWRDEFSTGIDSVDHEHQELVGLVNRVIREMDSADQQEVVIESLGDLNAKIAAHFALEELIMKQAKYVDFEPHKDDHERLLDEIRDIMDAYELGEYTARRDDFIAHLTGWFVTHFSTMDAKLHSAGIGA